MRVWCLAVLLICGWFVLPVAHAGVEEIRRTENAVRVLSEMRATPDQRIPSSLLAHAEAVAVIPDVVKAGLIVGGRHGKGLFSVRSADGSWSNPSFIRLSGASLGLQAGVQSSDLILVFRSRRGVDSLKRGEFTLGASASVAAGPVGRYTEASTNAELKAEIFAYSRARGLFAGISVNGARLKIDRKANALVYGENITLPMIFAGQTGPLPSRVIDFRDQLEEASAE